MGSPFAGIDAGLQPPDCEPMNHLVQTGHPALAWQRRENTPTCVRCSAAGDAGAQVVVFGR